VAARVGEEYTRQRVTRSEYLPTGSGSRCLTFSHLWDGMIFLDIYAGTGSAGIEALSRGCAGVVFIEKEPLHAAELKKNLTRCGFDETCEVIVSTAQRGIQNSVGTKPAF